VLRKMLRLMLAFLVARSSALALQPALARSATASRSAAAVRSAAFMQVDWDAREAEKKKAAAEAHAKLLAHLRAPIRQYEGGWGDTSLRGGGKDKDRFGTGPDANIGKDFSGKRENVLGSKDGASATTGEMTGKIFDDERRKTKSARSLATLSPEKQALLVLPEESFKVTKMAMSQTDEDFVMECNEGEEAEMVIDIEPMFLTKEEYFYGFTADSDPKFSIEYIESSEIEGEMDPKDHAAKRDGTATSLDREEDTTGIEIKIKFAPESAVGEFDAYLCFMFPNEKAFSKFYKITGKSTMGDATRDAAPPV